jgi:transcriptional regulator with XRE-family HTH domain
MRKNHLAYFRKKRGFTQEQLAERLGTSQTQIMRLETGRRKLTFEWAEKLSGELLCSPVQLYYGEASETYPEAAKEKKLLDDFSVLPEDEQKNFMIMMEALASKWRDKQN